MLRSLFLFSATAVFSAAGAQVRLPSIFSDNMVLQREAAVTIWGWSAPGQKIFVTNSWNNTIDSTQADGGARWSLRIDTPAAGGPYTLAVKGGNTITFNNVMIGEVWVCSGQSNMQWSNLSGLVKADSVLVAKARNPNVRFLQIPFNTSDHPQDDVPTAGWKECTPETAKSFSSVAYFFGNRLAEELNVPVGLINSSWGGTPAEVWTPADEVNASPELRAAAEKQHPHIGRPHVVGSTYNAMIAPFTRYAVAGAIWYQGESNVPTANDYDRLMRTMISSWRKAWNKDFPFYYVQIAPYKYGNQYAALLREAQTKTLGLPKTGMVVVSDLTENVKDIHPRQKKGVGERLANLALAETYSRPVGQYKNPLYRSFEIKKDKAIVYFDNASEGLMIKDGEKKAKPTEFYIAGEDRNFLPADVKIEGDHVIVSSRQVANPVAVRFSFSDAGIGNIFSKGGLPVAPFRTDNWED